MPVLTPSRIAIVAIALTLVSVFLTLGVPTQLAQPARPIIDHSGHAEHKNVHSGPMLPAPSVTEDGQRWEDKDRPSTPSTPLPTHPSAKASTATTAHSAPAGIPQACNDVPGAAHVMVVLRTSKAEIKEKLPPHVKTLLACVPNFAIFSDHDGETEGIKVHNALDSIGSETKQAHNEFHEYQIMHADAEHKPDVEKTKKLDKWKFLPMAYKAYHLKSDARFFLFIEADTSLSWTNVLQWINRLDYRIPYYSGAPALVDNIQVAQRGSGIMLSQGALRRYAKSYDELYKTKWEPELAKTCCGDVALAHALSDAHVEFYSSWPLMQSEQPSTLDYTDKHWCAPAITWHHNDAAVLDAIWKAQQRWIQEQGWNKPFLYRDAFDSLVAPHVAAHKANWDNLAQDTKIVAPQGRQKQLKDEEERRKQATLLAAPPLSPPLSPPPPPSTADGNTTRAKEAPPPPAHKRDEQKKQIDLATLSTSVTNAADSAETCQRACDQVDACLQWRYQATGDGECHLGTVLRLGSGVDENQGWSSGWVVERVRKTIAARECKKIKWGFYQ
ncbi:hypothetical protein ACEQ8H_007517 [Pleosporales sp. CAS-2024a]